MNQQEYQQELAGLAIESKNRDLLTAKLEAEVIALIAKYSWVKSADRLPTTDTKALAWVNDSHITCGEFSVEDGSWDLDAIYSYDDNPTVTYWMPLPDMPGKV